MNNQSQTKNCQNCKKDFTIESEDFNFYEKIKVPPPTFCPECRQMRRMAFRNERALYRRGCDLCKKQLISHYADSVLFPVYCRDCWYGDGWDSMSYGKDYDFSRTFFEQYKELINTVPRPALWQRNAVNSEYSNLVGESKNVYLSASVTKGSENVFYSKTVDSSRDIFDSMNVTNGGEELYENIDVQGNYNSQYLILSRNCIDSYCLIDCVNCSNCILSSNLRNKKYCILNKEYSREDYFKELEKFDFKSRIFRDKMFQNFLELKNQAIYRFANIIKCIDATGNNLLNCKNSKNCFDVYNAENIKYCYRAYDFKDCMDLDYGLGSELTYEYMTGAVNNFNVKFCYSVADSRNVDYAEWCANSADIFGCIGVRNKNNVILNKLYSTEEYKKLREQIIQQMEDMPFIDKAGRVYKYGEFFPIELSTWLYNETLAQEFYPLTQAEAFKRGYSWREPDIKNFNISIEADKIPDNIDEVGDEILKEVLGCAHVGACNHQCNTAFKITDYELKFYKKHNIPLPILCPNCRHAERFKMIQPLKLWNRVCVCDKENHGHDTTCLNEFETPYAPDRPEKVYCEDCYNKEIY